MASSFEVRRLARDHAAAVLAFELQNRDYFARSVSDRGDSFYKQFDAHHEALLADQAAGSCVFHILVESDGSVIGRVNLYELENGSAVLGYRIAEHVTGRGVATEAVETVAALARDQYGLSVLLARVSDTNLASRRVLEKSGFVATGPTEINSEPGAPATLYRRDLQRSDG